MTLPVIFDRRQQQSLNGLLLSLKEQLTDQSIQLSGQEREFRVEFPLAGFTLRAYSYCLVRVLCLSRSLIDRTFARTLSLTLALLLRPCC